MGFISWFLVIYYYDLLAIFDDTWLKYFVESELESRAYDTEPSWKWSHFILRHRQATKLNASNHYSISFDSYPPDIMLYVIKEWLVHNIFFSRFIFRGHSMDLLIFFRWFKFQKKLQLCTTTRTSNPELYIRVLHAFRAWAGRHSSYSSYGICPRSLWNNQADRYPSMLTP